MKRAVTLVVALVLILLITQLEDYLGHVSISSLTTDNEQIDYYLADFSVMAVADDGSVSYAFDGRHLSHWQGRKQSLIIAPQIHGQGATPEERLQLRADEARVDQKTQLAELSGDVHALKPQADQQGKFEMRTDRLTYHMQHREMSTDTRVTITSPAGTMQATGMTGKLDEDLLRFHSNVRSTYNVKP